MEEFRQQIKNFVRIFRNSIKYVVVFIVVIVVIVLLSGFTYFITVDDGTFKEDDWSSTPYAASTYVNGVTVDDSGTLSSNSTAQELWDKMLENGSSVDDYLDSPEELAKLMKAEIITQYPDTRPNPDEEINWDEIIEGDTLQGIIKFKRADTEGNTSTMTYVDPQTFQSYIDEYNETGSETAKQNALTHFTLKKGVSSSSSGAINYNGPDLCWPIDSVDIGSKFGVYREATGKTHKGLDIRADEGTNVYACEDGVVTLAEYNNSTAGNYIIIDHGNGYKSRYLHNSVLNVSVGDEVKKGDVIAASGDTGDSAVPHLHFEILYNDTAVDPLSFKYNNGQGEGTGGFGEDDEDEEETEENKTDENKTEDNKTTSSNLAQEVAVSGDGYDSEYTSSSGITYKQFKQYKGSYASQRYWSGDIESSGCGPTSMAILLSGLTDFNYTPADTARMMTEKFGYTNVTSGAHMQEVLRDLGIESEYTYAPTSDDILNALRSGKVLMISVGPETGFTSDAHIMALVDVNDQGQVYISNPSSDTRNGWWDLGEIMKRCYFMVSIDSGATGIAGSGTSNGSAYTAVVATWTQVDTEVTTDDPNVEPYSTTEYRMTTTNVNYEEMVDPYTMPFDLLWALLVTSNGKSFVMDLADLVYDSNIEITVHDNLTVNTDVDTWTYTKRTKSADSATITANCGGSTATGTVDRHEHDPAPDVGDENYTTIKTVVTQTNTINVQLTRANVWIVDYQNEFTYEAPTSSTSTDEKTQEDTNYPEEPNSTENKDYSCDRIESKKNELAQTARNQYSSTHTTTSNTTSPSSPSNPSTSGEVTIPAVTYEVNATVEYYYRYINIKDSITHTVETQKYTSGTPTLKEKTDPKSEEPNFVTIFNDSDNEKDNSSIRSVSSWLFEIIETNESTADMLDLIKYLLYKATGADYGVTEFDFSIFYPGSMSSVSGDWTLAGTIQEKVWIALRSAGFSEIAAAGAMGNIDYESSGFSPGAIEGGVGEFEGGIGLCQWTGIRNQQLRQFAASQGKDWTDENIQVEFLLAELGITNNASPYASKRTVGAIGDGPSGTIDGWKNATTIEDATIQFMAFFESPASIASYQTRLERAKSYYEQFKGYTGAVSNTQVLQYAKEIHDFLNAENYTYAQGYPIPPNSQKLVDCSAFVCAVLERCGYSGFGRSTADFASNISGNKYKGQSNWEVYTYDKSILQAGDVLLWRSGSSGHTAIYAGNGRLYDCGNTARINTDTISLEEGAGSVGWQHIIRVK